VSDIFEEVDDNVRADKLDTWWKQYRGFVFAGAGLVVGAVAANDFLLKPYLQKQRAERTRAFETAVADLENGNYAEAETALKAIAEGKGRLAPLAASYLAQARYEGNGDADGAAQALSAIASPTGGPLGRLALLKVAYFNADKQTLADIETTLGPLLAEETELGALARELVAAKAYASGDAARARTEYNRLLFDAKSTDGIRQRAEMALSVIPVTPAAAPAATQPEPATPPTKETE
jgi:hypothetical protein